MSVRVQTVDFDIGQEIAALTKGRCDGGAISSFIGTVRGIGAALGQAHEAMAGNIAGVTSSLGVAFNSTFIALLISMVVMFFMHQLQLIQERLVLDSHAYCENKLLRFLKAPK